MNKEHLGSDFDDFLREEHLLEVCEATAAKRVKRGVHLTIRTLREATGKTQAEVAEASKIAQADISRLEGREAFAECQVSTLERYIAALGGQLELVATFGDKKIILAGAQSEAVTGEPLASKRLGRRA
jgi:hypothetical protein